MMTEYNETDTCWHLMVTTVSGTISMLRNLDAPTARQAYQRLLPDTRPKKFINTPESGAWSYGGFMRSGSDVSKVDILGPLDAKLDPWRGVEPLVIDVALERKRDEATRDAMRSTRERTDAIIAKHAEEKATTPKRSFWSTLTASA